MNQKSDEPTNQVPESAQPEQPKYRAVSQEELKQILEAHQKWLESDGKEGKQADLTRANLQGANLQEADLSDANLQGAILSDANLQEANLLGANLQRANLRYANLQGVNFRESSLSGLPHIPLSYFAGSNPPANLRGADLRHAKGLTRSQIKQADNWRLAFYSDDLLKELGLPADHNETVKKKFAEIEKEKKKAATEP